jgi:transposase
LIVTLVQIGDRLWHQANLHESATVEVYTLIETCKMNDVDPQAWLADVLARLPDHPASKVTELLP